MSRMLASCRSFPRVGSLALLFACCGWITSLREACAQEAPDPLVPGMLRSDHPHPDSLWTVTIAGVDLQVFTLRNGMRCAVVPDSSARFVTLRTMVEAGPVVEPPGQEGVGHFLEHLAFTSSERFPDGRVDRSLALYAAYRNASTHPWGVEYTTKCIPQFLPEILEIEADRLANPRPTGAEFEREKAVVLQELVLRRRSDAASDLLIAVVQRAYDGHPFGRPIGGTETSVSNLTLDDVLAFHARHVVPLRTAILVSGPVSTGQLRKMLHAAFGDWSAEATGLPVAYPPLPEIHPGTVEQDRDDIEGFLICSGIRAPSATPTDKLLSYFVAAALPRPGLNLHYEILGDEAVLSFYGHYLFPKALVDAGVTVEEAPAPEVSVQNAWAFQWQEVDQRCMYILAPLSFAKVKDKVLNRFTGGLRDDPVLLRMITLDLLTRRDLGWLSDMESRLRSLDADSLRGFIDRYFEPNRLSRGATFGSDSGRPRTRQLAGLVSDRVLLGAVDPARNLGESEIRPVLSAYGGADHARIEKARTREGAAVYLLQLPAAEGIRFRGRRSFGLDASEGKSPGLCQLYSRLVDYDWRSPGKRDEQREDRGYRSDLDAEPSAFKFEFQCAEEDRLDQGLKEFSARLASREFNVSRWRDIRAYPEAYLGSGAFRPSMMASFARHALLTGNPDAIAGAGTPRTIEKLKYEDFQKLHEKLLERGELTVVAVSGRSRDDQVAILDAALGRFAKTDKSRQPELWVSPIAAPEGLVVSDFNQSDCSVWFSFPPLSVSGPDAPSWASTYLAMNLIQQQVASRLRKEAGGAYATGVTFTRLGDMIFLEIGFRTDPRTLRKVCDLLREEVTTLRDGMEADGVARAQLAAIGQLYRVMEDPEAALSLLDQVVWFPAPPEDPIQAVIDQEVDDVRSVVARLLDPGRFVLSVVGPLLEEEIAQILH